MGWSYKASCGVYTGQYHQMEGSPCQDKIALHQTREVLCAALSDGAGSRPDSGLGAACVTRHVSQLLCSQFDMLWTMEPDSLANLLVQSCQTQLAQEDPLLDALACTLLFFAGHQDGRYLAGHLGDGVQILVQGDQLSVFSPPENGDALNETFFITEDRAAEHLRLRRGHWVASGALLLMSDGMSASLYQQETGQPAPGCRTLAKWLRQKDETTMDQVLFDNMDRLFSRHSPDDLSLVLLVWEPQEETEEEMG